MSVAVNEPGYGELLLEDLELDEVEELWTEGDDADHTGWYCVSTDPFPCPASGCTFVAEFMERGTPAPGCTAVFPVVGAGVGL